MFEGGSTLADLHQALEDYLPVLLGLVKDGSHLQHKVQFVWINQEDDAEVGEWDGLPIYYLLIGLFCQFFSFHSACSSISLHWIIVDLICNYDFTGNSHV